MTTIDRNTEYSALVSAIRSQLGAAIVSPGAALQAVPGAHPIDPVSAARQRIHRGTYPWPIVTVAPGVRAVLCTDIAKTLLGLSVATPEPETEQTKARKRTGRPRKTAQQSGGAK